MKKNILTENMKRFGTKNLTEQTDSDANNNGYTDSSEHTIDSNNRSREDKLDLMIVFIENRKIVEAFDKFMSHINSAQQKNKLSPNAIKALELAKKEIDKLPK